MAGTPVGTMERSSTSAWGAVYRHRWKVLVAGLVLAVAGYFAAGQWLEPRYAATATITLDKDRPFDPTAVGQNAANLGDSTQWAVLQAAVVDSSAVLDTALEPVATPDGGTVSVPAAEAEDFRDGLTITGLADTNQITVTATASSAQAAADIADAVAYAYQARSLAQVTAATNAVVGVLDPVGDAAQIQQLNIAAASYGSGVGGVQPARVPEAPTPPTPLHVGLVAGLAGLLAAAGAVAWGAHLKQRVTAPPLPGLVELARWGSLPAGRALADPTSAPSRSAGVVLVGLQHLGHLRTPRLEISSVLVTATSGSAGALATGIAAAAARSGRRVVLVDADESGSQLAAHGAPVGDVTGRSVPERRWSEEVRPWGVGGGAVVSVLPLDARTLQPHGVGAGIRHLVEAGYLVVFVGGSVVSSPVAFAVAGEVDAVLVQVEADPRAELVSRTTAQLSIAAPAVVAQVVVGDPSPAQGGAPEARPAEQRPRPVVQERYDEPTGSAPGRRG
ncbi:hypothetical protein MO973_29295 [Paenibacillus sp. TRM 82003]|uniref:hypothetical protein n=1 Tax=Kineococcus sp. TRM81007 TaxID=2925831 RepID=UPI001F57FAC4|nr:hypothetical protein [Kineococcus sp. TRM81007]MCI2238919.1 hypothetical protein [Kineococcus sp. TRM81007]MCI3924326.1 hypothetical protein [Paenibacillus sp. TRM 82003]